MGPIAMQILLALSMIGLLPTAFLGVFYPSLMKGGLEPGCNPSGFFISIILGLFVVGDFAAAFFFHPWKDVLLAIFIYAFFSYTYIGRKSS